MEFPQTAVVVRVNVEMSLAEALELDARLSGGPATETSEALRIAMSIQLDAARQAITMNARSA